MIILYDQIRFVVDNINILYDIEIDIRVEYDKFNNKNS